MNAIRGAGVHPVAFLDRRPVPFSRPPRSREEAVADVPAAHLGEPDPLPEESFAVTVGDDGRIRCGCGWTGTTAEDADEWREHLADAILEALGRVE